MIEATLMNLTVVSQTFPNSPSPEVDRENLVETISDILNGESNIVLVSGPLKTGSTHRATVRNMRFPFLL